MCRQWNESVPSRVSHRLEANIDENVRVVFGANRSIPFHLESQRAGRSKLQLLILIPLEYKLKLWLHQMKKMVSSDRTQPSAYAFDVAFQRCTASDRCRDQHSQRDDRLSFCDCAHAITATPVAPSNLPHVHNACYLEIRCRNASAQSAERSEWKK